MNTQTIFGIAEHVFGILKLQNSKPFTNGKDGIILTIQSEKETKTMLIGHAVEFGKYDMYCEVTKNAIKECMEFPSNIFITFDKDGVNPGVACKVKELNICFGVCGPQDKSVLQHYAHLLEAIL